MRQATAITPMGLCWKFVCGGLLASLAGCATPVAKPIEPVALTEPKCVDTQTVVPQIERGRPMVVLDAVGWVVGVPSKILFLDHRINNHHISAETEAMLSEYLAANDLDGVKVRVNQYDPIDEWRRLRHNDVVGWPIRYTFGTLSWVGYTVFPGRIFGGDGYNPYTNTIEVYSDVPAMALYEGGHAMDYSEHRNRGLYAVAHGIPGVGMLCHDATASAAAMDYLQEHGTEKEIKEGYRVVCPAYALDASEPIASFTGLPLVLPAVVAGHVVGQVKAANVPDTPASQAAEQQIHSTAYQPADDGIILK
jgi:hypothetical protein